MAFVLIVVVFAGYGVTSTLAEFSSEPACLHAAATLKESLDRFGSRAEVYCFPKG